MDEDIAGGIAKVTGFILLVIFFLPWIVSSLVIDWFGNYTNSVYIFIGLHIFFGIILIALALAPTGFWLGLILGFGGLMLLIDGGVMIHEMLNEGFDFVERFERFDNWHVPSGG